MNVIPYFLKWVYQILAGDATVRELVTSPDGSLRIYESQSPKGQSLPTGFIPQWPSEAHYPLVRIKAMATPHTRGNGGRRFATHPEVLIEAIDAGNDLDGMWRLADRIDALFGRRVHNVNFEGLIIAGGIGLDQSDMTETPEEQTYKRLGGLYRYFVFPAPPLVGEGGGRPVV